MARGGDFLNSSRADESTDEMDLDLPPELNSVMESFHSPSNHNILPKGARQNPVSRTPKRPLAQLPNRQTAFGKHEFTPLLQSVQRTNLRKNINDRSLEPTPSRRRSGYDENSGSLPGGDTETLSSIDKTLNKDPPLDNSSIHSTPVARLRPGDQGTAGILGNEGALTLREQERIIDDMKKENFGLKLKVFFLDDKLKKLGPEYNEQAIKENVDLKVGVATLRDELKRYKKSLHDSEKIITELQADLNSRKSSNVGKDSLEQIRRLERIVDEKEGDLNGVLDDNDKLRRELKQLQEKGSKDNASELQQLRDENEDLRNKLEDLERDLRNSDAEIQNKEDELENLQDKAKEAEERVQDLEEDNRQLSDQIKSLELQKGADTEKDRELRSKQQKLEQLEAELQQLRNELEGERTERNHAMLEKDNMEDEVEKLQQKNKELLEDKHSLEEENENLLESEAAIKEKNRKLEMEVEELRDQVRDKSFSLKSTATERDERLKVLQLQYEELRIAKQNLDNDNKSRVEEVRRLNKRLQDMKEEFDTEVKALQEQIELLKDDKDGLSRAKSDLEMELRKAKTELNAALSEKNILANRQRDLGSESKDLADHLDQARREISELAAELDQERQKAAEDKSALEADWKADVQELEAQSDELKARLKEEQEAKVRRERELEHENRQLQTRVETLQRNIQSLQDTLDKIQNNETTLHGKEARLQEAYNSEKQRAARTEESLNRQIQELSDELRERKRAFEGKVNEVRQLSEELRISQRSEAALQEKIQELNDEIDVLNAQAEDQHQNVDGTVSSMRAELDSVRTKFNSAKAEVLALENKLVSLEADANSFKGELDVQVRAHRQAKSDLQDALRRLEGAKKEKQQLHEQLVTASTQVNSLKLSKMEVEAKRDELQSRLNEMQQQVGATKGLDQEKMELRRAKSRLEIEVQRLTDERELMNKKADTLEADLEEAYRAARDEEAKLEKQIWDLTNRLSSVGDSTSRELASAKRTIARLEQRIEDLLSRSNGTTPAPGDATSLEMEVAALSDKLSDARKRESDLTRKEAANRKTINDLKQQVDSLERDLYEARNSGDQSAFGSQTPRASLKSDLETLRNKLASSQKDTQDLRLQIKSMERKCMQLQTQATSAEHEKELLEQDIQTLRESKEDLEQKVIESTSTIGQLRQRIYSLERDVQDAKLQNITAKATGANRSESPHIGVDEAERRELHSLLKSTTLQLETAQAQLKARNEALDSHLKREAQLESQLRTLRKDRSDLQDNLQSAESQTRKLTNKVRKAEQQVEETKKAWEAERNLIAKRMKHTENRQVESAEHDHAELMELQTRVERDTIRHEAELKGLVKQIRYLKARVEREKKFRKDLAFTKDFFLMQVKMFNTCNEAHLQLIEQMGIVPDRRLQDKRPTLKAVALAVIAGIRIWNRNEEWAEARQLRMELDKGLRKHAAQRSRPVEKSRAKSSRPRLRD